MKFIKQMIRKKMLILFCVVGIIFVIYVYGAIYYNSHLFKNTIINGINVSKLDITEVKNEISKYKITIKEINSDGSIFNESIYGNTIDLKIAKENKLEEIINNQNNYLWFANKGNEYNDLEIISINEDKLEAKILELKGFSEEVIEEPVDAYISGYNDEKGYQVVKEIEGNKLSDTITKEVIKSSIMNLNKEVDLKKNNCYIKPNITSKDKGLAKKIDILNKYTSVKIEYAFGNKTEILDGNTINEWISLENDEVNINKDKVIHYVNKLKKKYDTIFTTRTFQTSYGAQITIDGGDYGWWINSDEEALELIEIIKNQKSQKRTPIYYQTAASYKNNDYGNTYVEINLTAQHLFLYKDGKLVLESDIVSGNLFTGNGTPSGIYSITYIERDSVLVGENYETPVSYWIPFNGNIGLHDAIWRDQFGSNIYSTAGSHGCINLPYLVAKELFNNLKQGMPVICYELAGTESSQITNHSSEEKAQSIIDAIDNIGQVTKSSKKKIERARQLYEQVNIEVKAHVSNYEILINAEQELKALG